MRKALTIILLILTACAVPESPITPTTDLNAIISLTSQAAQASTAAAQPTTIPVSQTPSITSIPDIPATQLPNPASPFSPLAIRFGAEGLDYGKDIISDAAGNLYTVGYFQGSVELSSGKTITATGDSTSPGAVDMYLAKFMPNGALEWVFSVGGTGADMPHSLVQDSAGNLYLTGYFAGQVDFDPSPATTALFAGIGRNIFLAKYSPAGELLWVMGLGDEETSPTDEEGREEGMDVSIDSNGNAYITGVFNGTIDLDPADGNDSEDTFSSRERDIFFASYAPNGAYRWGKTFGGTGRDAGHTLDVDSNGNINLAGFFSESVDFAGRTATSNGGWDIFLAQFDSHGGMLWLNTFGGSANDQARPGGIAIGPANNIYLTGDFGAVTDFDSGADNHALTSNGLGDIFIAKYTSSGVYEWAIGMGGAGLDGGHRLAVEQTSGNVYLTGWFRQTADFNPSAETQILTARAAAEASDILIASYTASGAYRWARQIGAAVTSGEEWSLGTGITLTPNGGVAVTGRFFQTTDFNPDAGESLLTSVGKSDVFILQLGSQSGEFSTSAVPAPVTTALPAQSVLVPVVSNIFNQSCAVGSVTNFNTCTDSYCCETNAACNNDPDCVAAAQCFQQNGGMRGYGGISNCYQMPGAEKYMQNFACRFQYCGQFMTLNEGELCLTEKCAEVTAACFSNPDCFALKFCIVDKSGTPAECRQRHPEGIPDFERWTACGNETGCYALMP